MASACIEDRAFVIYSKLQREQSTVSVYLINGVFRTTKKDGMFSKHNMVGVYSHHAELSWIEDDMRAQQQSDKELKHMAEKKGIC